MRIPWTFTFVLAIAVAAGVSGLVPGAARTQSAEPVKVGVIYERTGALSIPGAMYIQGLKLGLQYLTKGTNTVNGRELELTIVDDGTDATKAVAAAKDLIGSGHKIILGIGSSGIALQVAPLAEQNNVVYIVGGAVSDALTGINRNTFRSARQAYQDVLTFRAAFPPQDVGKKVVVFVEDTAYGHSNVAAVRSVFGTKHNVSSIVVPFGAADLTPFIEQLKNARPDAAIVAWAGPNGVQLWNGFQQQGIPKLTQVITGLGVRATWQTFGPLVPGVNLISWYVAEAPKNRVNDWLVKTMQRKGQVPDAFTPDGFVAAEMLVRAVERGGGTNVARMIQALEGWQFSAPKGIQRIRPQDHAMIQPMFVVQLVRNARGRYVSKLIKTVSPGNVQPPVTPFK